jgi:hypothetical protein
LEELDSPAGGTSREQLQLVEAERLIRLQVQHKASDRWGELFDLQRGNPPRKGLGLGLPPKESVGKIQHYPRRVLQHKQKRTHLSLGVDL